MKLYAGSILWLFLHTVLIFCKFFLHILHILLHVVHNFLLIATCFFLDLHIFPHSLHIFLPILQILCHSLLVGLLILNIYMQETNHFPTCLGGFEASMGSQKLEEQSRAVSELGPAQSCRGTLADALLICGPPR